MKKQGFSLVEILVALITISVIVAVMSPVITKKLNSKETTIINNTSSSSSEYLTNCEQWEDCTFCTETQCALCSKNCATDEFVNTPDCVCEKCSTKFSNCLECSNKKCKKCQSGYGLGTSSCTQCQVGQYSDGSTECKPSPIGHYVDTTGASNPTPCQAGKYQDQLGQANCILCTAGSYQLETGKSSCNTCEIDYMCTGGNNRVQCAINMGAYEGSNSCSNCPANCADCQVPDNCLKCNAGYYLGYYMSKGECYKCPEGYSCPGTTEQNQCNAGYFSSGGAGTCTKCADMQYSTSGATTCTDCSAGTYSTGGDATCSSCSDKWENCTSCTLTSCNECAEGMIIKNEKCESAGMQYTYTGDSDEITLANGKKLIKFTSDGTLTVTMAPSSNVEIFAVGGGGAGGYNRGGGGGGGYVSSANMAIKKETYSIKIGAGGAPTTAAGNSGSKTIFGANLVVANGGSGGSCATGVGGNGGSGGGGAGGKGGANGNNGSRNNKLSSSAGGTGAGVSTYFQTGYYAGGGGGGGFYVSGSTITGAAGGTGGGGKGGNFQGAGTSGTANTGGGGGGGGAAATGGRGGSGIVIIVSD